jgi:hypothetical protein
MTMKHTFYKHGIDLNEMGIKPKQLIILSVAGSHMHGTNTPNSDKDYMGVYIPTAEDILLNKVKHHLKLPEEYGIDIQIWSIYKFFDLACKGETLAIDLLHSPYNCWLIYSDIWYSLVERKSEFYTKQMSSFVSFARTQAAKYGIKGSRIKAVKEVMNFLKFHNQNTKLSQIWNLLPTGDHIHFLNDISPFRMYQVCGKKYQETVRISYIYEQLEKHLTSYGKRAMIAESDDGIDWKAISHALRSAEQVFWILNYGYYKFPLKNADFIRKVKLGEINFKMAQAVLEDYMNEIEKKMETSTLPETIDKGVWKQWLAKFLCGYLIHGI